MGSPSVQSTGPNRIPSLDGLRAFSILFVIVSHIAVGLKPRYPGHLAQEILGLFNLGRTGVVVFFVISGFLITSLLLSELDRRGSIHLGRFYFRRTLRIFPPYYAYLVIVSALVLMRFIPLYKPSLLWAATYTYNYCESCHGKDNWYVVHSWSLAVEEQFYLLWPGLLALLRRKKGMWFAIGVMVLCPILRLYSTLTDTSATPTIIYFQSQFVADSLAAGAVLAGFRQSLHAQTWYMRLLQSRWFFLWPLGAFLLMPFSEHPRLYNPGIFVAVLLPLMNIAIALTLDWCVTFWQTAPGRILNSAPIAYVGTLSYSIYLWQEMFLDANSRFFPAYLPVLIIGIAAASAGSYYLVEQPALRARQEWESRMFGKARGSKPAAVDMASGS